MKAIMLSVNPNWMAEILNGKKTIEVRKTCPEVFKHLKPYEGCSIDVYLYCTSHKNYHQSLYEVCEEDGGGYDVDWYDPCCDKKHEKEYLLNGLVVAKFRLNKVEEIKYQRVFEQNPFHCLEEESGYGTKTLNAKEFKEKSCLTDKELEKYLNTDKPNAKGYAWYIDDLEIFDKPKELSDFYKWFKFYDEISDDLKNLPVYKLDKAPQSYCYIEVEGE